MKAYLDVLAAAKELGCVLVKGPQAEEHIQTVNQIHEGLVGQARELNFSTSTVE